MDLIASEYGWRKDDILCNVYPDEYLLIAKRIYQRQTDDLLIKLRIASNPHLESKHAQEFVDMLMKQRNDLYDLDDIEPELDKEAFMELKRELQKNRSKIGVKVVS